MSSLNKRDVAWPNGLLSPNEMVRSSSKSRAIFGEEVLVPDAADTLIPEVPNVSYREERVVEVSAARKVSRGVVQSDKVSLEEEVCEPDYPEQRTLSGIVGADQDIEWGEDDRCLREAKHALKGYSFKS